jgi:hypothetical protein
MFIVKKNKNISQNKTLPKGSETGAIDTCPRYRATLLTRRELLSRSCFRRAQGLAGAQRVPSTIAEAD